MKHKRKLTVSTAHKVRGNHYHRQYVATSMIRPQRRLLVKAGFKPSDKIEVLVAEGMVIIIKKG